PGSASARGSSWMTCRASCCIANLRTSSRQPATTRADRPDRDQAATNRPALERAEAGSSGDLQPLRRRRRLLGQRELQNAVLEARGRPGLVDLRGQREAARHRAVVAFAAQHALAFLLLGLALHLGRDRDAIAVDLDVDVLFLHPGHLGLDAVVAVGLLDLDL